MQRKIPASRIVVLPKISLWSLLQHRLALSDDGLIAHFRQAGRRYETQRESHQRQQRSWEVLSRIFDKRQIIAREWLTPDTVPADGAVFVVGGDNHLQFCAQFLAPGVPVVGINSDRGGSYGVTLRFGHEDPAELERELRECITRLETGNYEVEQWPRLRIEVSSQPVRYALSQARFVAPDPDLAVRVSYQIGARRTPANLPSSGLIVAAPAGKTGHFGSASRYLPHAVRQQAAAAWPLTSPLAYYVLQEPFKGDLAMDHDFSAQMVEDLMLFGALRPGETLEVQSGLFDGEVRVDTDWRLSFPSDTIARVTVAADYPLTVMKHW